MNAAHEARGGCASRREGDEVVCEHGQRFIVVTQEQLQADFRRRWREAKRRWGSHGSNRELDDDIEAALSQAWQGRMP